MKDYISNVINTLQNHFKFHLISSIKNFTISFYIFFYSYYYSKFSLIEDSKIFTKKGYRLKFLQKLDATIYGSSNSLIFKISF